MVRNFKNTFILSTSIIAILFLFQNCSFNDVRFAASGSSDQGSTVGQGIVIPNSGNGDGYAGIRMESPKEMFYGDYLPLDASGGVPPYSYSIISGSGSIVANTGQTVSTVDYLYMASTVELNIDTYAEIQVEDSLGNTDSIAVTISKRWTRTADFESGIDSQPAVGSDGFTSANARSIYSIERAHTGVQSAEIQILSGATDLGAQMQFPTSLHDGNEVWIRAYIHYPSFFDVPEGVGSLPQTRINTVNFDNIQMGFIDTFVELLGGNRRLGVKNFPANEVTVRELAFVQPDVWHSYEQYIRFSADSNQAIYRVWQDGNLVYESLDVPTLANATDRSDYVNFWEFYAGGAPKFMSVYVDDIAITSEPPTNMDANGNLFIGP